MLYKLLLMVFGMFMIFKLCLNKCWEILWELLFLILMIVLKFNCLIIFINLFEWLINICLFVIFVGNVVGFFLLIVFRIVLLWIWILVIILLVKWIILFGFLRIL